jgi:protein-S-isoprenylcysteine O-methyltransferase Ste14
MNRLQIEPEEEALTELFGESYRQYQRKVRRWL